MRAGVDVYKNKRTGLYLVQRKCQGPPLEGLTSVGEAEVLSEQELKHSGANKLLDAIDSSLKPCANPEQTRRFTQEEFSKFCSAHHYVSITRWSDGNGQLEVRPMQRVRGGHRSIKGGMICVLRENIGSKLIATILDAFRIIVEGK
jgi:hypothetical protein